MIGDYYFSTGISIYQQYPGTDSSWIAQVEFEDFGHAQLGSMKGSLSTRYPTNLLAQPGQGTSVVLTWPGVTLAR